MKTIKGKVTNEVKDTMMYHIMNHAHAYIRARYEEHDEQDALIEKSSYYALVLAAINLGVIENMEKGQKLLSNEVAAWKESQKATA